MKPFQIWSEGYVVTGGSGTAHYIGSSTGHSFAHACQLWAKDNAEEAERLGGYCKLSNSIWGCRLHETKEAAERSFG